MRIPQHLIVLLFLSWGIFLPFQGTGANLIDSINKYKNNQVSREALERLAPFNRYIHFYSQCTFFRPRHKVSPDFIKALILAESSAKPRAVSNKGAMGLGQICYRTGKEAALELAQSRYHFRNVSRKRLRELKEKDLFDPEINILLTCYLISKYNYKFDGKLELVLTAWNAGAYQRDLQRGKAAPYKETQELIGKVNAYYIDLLRKRSHVATYTSRQRVR